VYTNHFGLKHFPFTITPDTDFFLDYGEFKDGLEMLLFSLLANEGMIKITGVAGMGKTLLCQKLRQSLDDNFMAIHLTNPSMSPGTLYRMFANQLGLKTSVNTSLSEQLDSIDRQLRTLQEEGAQVVLLIDEAQVLSNKCLEALRFLSNLETEKMKRLQIVLFGQPELDDRLQQRDMQAIEQRIAFSHQLKPLTEEAMTVYIEHRLHVAGYRGAPLFNPKALNLLHRGSGGVPRIINILAHKAMLVAFGRGSRMVDTSAVRQAIADTEGAIRQTNPFKVFNGLLGRNPSYDQLVRN